MEKPNLAKMGKVDVVYSEKYAKLVKTVLPARVMAALAEGVSSYPICRTQHFAVNAKLEEFLDILALSLGWRAHRETPEELILDTDGLFISVNGNFKKGSYSSIWCRIWAESVAKADEAKNAILTLCEGYKVQQAMFSISWYFWNGQSLDSAHIEEVADDKIFDEAYPELDEGVAKFINDYLASPEPILVLQGKPGTGKTRLIRAILGAMTLRKGEPAEAMYTSDRETLERGDLYLEYITGDADAFVIEDADYLLKPRSDGNKDLHRFLTIADGVVRAQGRKIIFSTNLPNVGDIDDALIRPGRCFSRLAVRELSKAEAEKLLLKLCAGDSGLTNDILEKVTKADSKGYSIAEIYRAHGQRK